jgi:hypothetical protein
MKPSHRIFPLVLGLFCAFTLMSQARVAQAKGGKGGDTVSKVVEINKQALANIQAGKFDAARDALWGAVTALNDAGLSEHEIAARTHIHLAAVYLTGFKDKSKAVRQFVMALKINPGIKITPQVDTPELTEAMDTARIQMAGGGSSTTAAAPAAAEPAEPSRKVRAARKVEDEEPSPPSKVKEPLLCPLPNEVPPDQDIMVRCVTQKKSRQASATLFYREAGSENFTPLPMVRSPKGWLSATVPGSAVTGTAFSFYISAKIPGSKDASLGSADSPTLLPIVSGASPMNNTVLAALLRNEGSSTTATTEMDDSAPLKEITDQYKIDEALRKYHRRHVGSVFISLGGGMGMTYHGSMKAAGRFNDKNGDRLENIPALAGSNPAALGQLVPEVGYVVSEKFAISLQGRLQYLPFDSSGLGPGSVKPATWALAAFLRGQYNFWTISNFQTFVSLAVGGGPHVFMGSIPKVCDTSSKSDQWLQDNKAWCTKGVNDHSNVILSGPVAAAAGVGFLWHITRNLGFWVEGRGMSSVAPVMFLGEVNAGFSVALKFEKSAPPPPKEGESGWEAPPEDKALFEAPPED